MNYQRGDRIITGESGRHYHLRLTFGSLARVCDTLGVDSFTALAAEMRDRPKEAIGIFANAMMKATGCEAEIEALDLPMLSEAVSGMIESALAPIDLASGSATSPAGGGRMDCTKLNLPPLTGEVPEQSEGDGGNNSKIPFTSWLKIAVQIYRLSPTDFWAMSLSDFFALLPEPHTPPGREQLSNLMTQFPDEAPS